MALDVSWRSCPPALVASGLTGDALALWERTAEATIAVRESLFRRMALESLSKDCAPVACPDLDCFQELLRTEVNETTPATKAALAAAQTQAIARLEAGAAGAGRASPHVSFALGSLLDQRLREVEEPQQQDLDRIAGLMRIAVEGTRPSDPFGWYARYELGRALDAAGHRGEAIAAWSSIDQSAPPEGVSRTEVAWRIADTMQLPDAAAEWARVVRRCPETLDSVEGILCTAAAYKWMAAAYERGSWPDVVTAGALVLSYSDQVDDGIDAREETYEALVTALDSLGGDELDRWPALPLRDVAPVQARLTSRANVRMQASRPDELTARVSDLGRSCQPGRDMGSLAPVHVRVEIGHAGTIRAHATPVARGAKAGVFEACLVRRAPWFFRDASSGVDVNVGP